jgi:hypothetical protein
MSLSQSAIDPYHVGRHRDGLMPEATGHGQGGPASKRVVVGYGFWIFLLSDIVMFSAFFAAYAVLQGAVAGGPSGRELFDPQRVAIETACLLTSSFTCGLAAVATVARSQLWTQIGNSLHSSLRATDRSIAPFSRPFSLSLVAMDSMSRPGCCGSAR